MPGRKGQRGSGGHNKKSAEEHERDGTRSHEGRADVPAGALDGVLSRVDTSADEEMRRLYRIYVAAAGTWESDPTDKEARLSACSAIDRFLRIASMLASEAPKDEPSTPRQSSGVGISMEDLFKDRETSGAPQGAN